MECTLDHSKETIYLSLSAQVALGTFFMKSLVVLYGKTRRFSRQSFEFQINTRITLRLMGRGQGRDLDIILATGLGHSIEKVMMNVLKRTNLQRYLY